METPLLVKNDPWLQPFEQSIIERISYYQDKLIQITNIFSSLEEMASAYNYYGISDNGDYFILREWAPNATDIYLIGNFNNWSKSDDFKFTKLDHGNWEIRISKNIIKHTDLFKLHVFWNGGDGLRLPAYIKRVVQDHETKLFSAQLWSPDKKFEWSDANFAPTKDPLLIYEAHIGMSSEEHKVSSFEEFKINILPRIKDAGYNTIQLMAIQEHPYYGSFGYHVSNFFAVSSRFGTPEDLKSLINEAHNLGIAVIMDIVHSHAVKNENEGIAKFDGTSYQYFHEGGKGEHPAWDSKCFNYGKMEVVQFLLSNCRYWIDEYHFDGYRFDGVTSMLYVHHGLEYAFSSYADYYNGTEDFDAIAYLTLANKLIHSIKPSAITIAEDMSGLPGISDNIKNGGLGFDYRLSMGVPDFWIKMIKEKSDEQWNVGQIFHELTQHRYGEKIISYTESHDQALVGDKTIIFRLVDKEMYDKMNLSSKSLVIDRGIALHKIIRLATLSTSYGGYLNFMGNEFGHPEWIDFPREGNNWSYKYARRQWSLRDNQDLKFKFLADFDKDMIHLAKTKFLNNTDPCYGMAINEADQIMCFKRNKYYFVFNFSPTNSYTDYGIFTNAGKYRIILNTDNHKYGGYDNIDEGKIYFTERMPYNRNQYQLKLYIPARTAFVMEYIPPVSVY